VSDKTIINIKAAKLVYPTASLIEAAQHGEHVEVMVDGKYVATNFNVFARAEDRERVVIALGEKHGVSICRYNGQDGEACWYPDMIYSDMYASEDYPVHQTYQESVVAAIKAVEI